jgi:hypothetical protein
MALQAAGRDIMRLSVGEHVVDTPDDFKRAAFAAS